MREVHSSILPREVGDYFIIIAEPTIETVYDLDDPAPREPRHKVVYNLRIEVKEIAFQDPRTMKGLMDDIEAFLTKSRPNLVLNYSKWGE